MRILVCGGRDFGDLRSLESDRLHPLWEKREKEYRFIFECIYALMPKAIEDDMNTWFPPGDIVIISGAARGADDVAIQWAVLHDLTPLEYPADWKKYGKAAGVIRNQFMLDDSKPDIVLAFPGGEGTAHMVSIAKKANIKVIEYEFST